MFHSLAFNWTEFSKENEKKDRKKQTTTKTSAAVPIDFRWR